MAQSLGQESFDVVDTGMGPVLALADLSVRCTLFMVLPFIRYETVVVDDGLIDPG
jgi:hypothetical protein